MDNRKLDDGTVKLVEGQVLTFLVPDLERLAPDIERAAKVVIKNAMLS
jgi:hypothetical protein